MNERDTKTPSEKTVVEVIDGINRALNTDEVTLPWRQDRKLLLAAWRERDEARSLLIETISWLNNPKLSIWSPNEKGSRNG